MPQPTKVDRDGLHRYLYRKAGEVSPFHRMPIKQIALAEDLGLDSGHMHRIIKEMVEAGRLKKVESGVSGVGVYSITNPDEWSEGHKPKRVLAWG